MKKSTRIILIIACGIGLIGIILMLIGAGMGATWEDARMEGKHGELTEADRLSTEEVTGLEFDIEGGAGVYVETWDQDYISIQTNGKLYHYRGKLDEDGSYEMEAEAHVRHSDGLLYVYIPRDKVLDRLEMEIGAGKAAVNGVSAERVTADVGAGALTFDGIINKDASFKCKAGETIVTLKGNPGDYNYDLSCGMGEIELNGENVGGLGCDRRIDNNALALIRLECKVGRIELNMEE